MASAASTVTRHNRQTSTKSDTQEKKKPNDSRRSNAEWLSTLQSTGREQHEAIADLRDYLLRAVYVYLSRNRSDLAHYAHDELQQFAEDCAQDALLLILRKLDTFRGDSKFTTWAYSIVINQAAGTLRRRRWSNISLDAVHETADDELPPILATVEDDSVSDPHHEVTRRQIWRRIRAVIKREFTDRQRTVFINQYFRSVPPDVIAEQLGTNRNNIYKISHDARVKLKKHLLAGGLSEEEILAAFQDETTAILTPEIML